MLLIDPGLFCRLTTDHQPTERSRHITAALRPASCC